MTMPNDPTAPVPVNLPPGGDPTMPVTPGSGDATMAVQSSGAGGGARGGPPRRGASGGGNGSDNSRIWMFALAFVIGGVLIGGCAALVFGGNDDSGKNASGVTTTSSSTSTSTSTSTSSTTTTTLASGPQVQQFTVSQNPVSCPNAGSTVNITLVWSTQNAQSVTISIDNPNGPYGTYGPTSQQQVPFACSVNPIKHTYYLTANGSNNQKVQKQIVVTGNVPTTTTASSTTTTT